MQTASTESADVEKDMWVMEKPVVTLRKQLLDLVRYFRLKQTFSIILLPSKTDQKFMQFFKKLRPLKCYQRERISFKTIEILNDLKMTIV